MLLLILLRKLCGNVQYYQSTKKVQATLDAEVKNKTKKAAKLTVKFDRKNLCSYVPASCTNCPNIINHVNAMFAKTLIWKRMDCFGIEPDVSALSIRTAISTLLDKEAQST